MFNARPAGNIRPCWYLGSTKKEKDDFANGNSDFKRSQIEERLS